MISVIIPALNEAKTIAKVVDYCNRYPKVSEVIVVDDCSSDSTAAIARQAGAKVITSFTRGKGASMKDGLAHAENEIIVFLDADIDPYPANMLHLICTPLLNDEQDFIKARFSRNSGRVTELLAKPLLSIFFPELTSYEQPLGGMIAGRKRFFENIRFFNDYGVDIGILIDMHIQEARIAEVHIGHIENKSKPLKELGRMSREVANAILFKAFRHSNVPAPFQPEDILSSTSQYEYSITR
ncbi:glycosyltransferase [Sediminibacterium ginsengisoli]|uniref:Glycosyl transferase family 2 n=1 Tax=Sediminibacterium ginsengisoli TaxID=413434 RepID=A0A1T4R3N8_9BACT|nr:glycosyltransferase [Sediminibacterium ginsengisoli]SKA10455.1 Glycosyl transferase family 2 [Sediminibacterium ginsengisoli]